MKLKTFEFDSDLARQFQAFCRLHMHVEKRIAAACLHHFMSIDAHEREQILLDYQRWLSAGSSTERPLLPALSTNPKSDIPNPKSRIPLTPGSQGGASTLPPRPGFSPDLGHSTLDLGPVKDLGPET